MNKAIFLSVCIIHFHFSCRTNNSFNDVWFLLFYKGFINFCYKYNNCFRINLPLRSGSLLNGSSLLYRCDSLFLCICFWICFNISSYSTTKQCSRRLDYSFHAGLIHFHAGLLLGCIEDLLDLYFSMKGNLIHLCINSITIIFFSYQRSSPCKGFIHFQLNLVLVHYLLQFIIFLSI